MMIKISLGISMLLVSSLAQAAATLTCQDLGSSNIVLVFELDLPLSQPSSPYAPQNGSGSAFQLEGGGKKKLTAFQNRTLEVSAVRGEENVTQYKLVGQKGEILLKLKNLSITGESLGKINIPEGSIEGLNETELAVSCSAE